MSTAFADRLIRWYERHKRDLPWRKTKNPYHIWLSEIILQQTRVAQGIGYYERFVDRFPDVQALADASEQEVLRLWQGLGYYSRARNLHHTARQIATGHQGRFPDNARSLQRLKGVGPYTAAAIASFAFDEPIAVVDGNVYRVLARYLGLATDINSPAAYAQFAHEAQRLLPADRAGTFNQAIMELGSQLCVPVAPRCMLCPVQHDCVALAGGQQAALPVKSPAKPARDRYFHYIVLRDPDQGYWLRQRAGRDIWRQLFDFPLVESPRPLREAELLGHAPLAGLLSAGGKWRETSAVRRHLLTHQRLLICFHTFVAAQPLVRSYFPELVRVTDQTLPDYPLPVPIRNFLNEA